MVPASGPPNVYSRASNRPDELLAFVEARLTSPFQPARNHLRSLSRLAGGSDGKTLSDLNALCEQILRKKETDKETLGPLFSALEGKLPQLGNRAKDAEWHLLMARHFLLGEQRDNSWRDPYTSPVIWIRIALDFATSHKTKIAGSALLLASILAILWAARRAWSSSLLREKPHSS
jgi:hypothetical protein